MTMRGVRSPGTLGPYRAGGGAPSLFQRVLRLASGRPVYTADYYAVDGITGRVAAFIDWNAPTQMLAQSVLAKQVAIPAAHADFGGALCATFSAVEDYVENTGAGSENWMHDGTGAELFFVFTPTAAAGIGTVLGDRGVTGRGFSIVNFAATSSMACYVLRAGDVFVVNLTGATFTQNVGTYLDFLFGLAQVPDATERNRTNTVASGNVTNAPQAGVSSQALRLGTDGSNFANMRWQSASFFPALTDPQRAVVREWILATTGIS